MRAKWFYFKSNGQTKISHSDHEEIVIQIYSQKCSNN